MLCGLHCVNNLLQGPYFQARDLARMADSLDSQEHDLLDDTERSKGGIGTHNALRCQSGACTDGGFFNVQVLSLALGQLSLELLPSRHPEAKDEMKDIPNASEAFVCQRWDHWFAVRRIGMNWWNVNSTLPRPILVSPDELSVSLTELDRDGHCIFLIRGSRLPKPMAPHSTSNMNCFHCVFDLLQATASEFVDVWGPTSQGAKTQSPARVEVPLPCPSQDLAKDSHDIVMDDVVMEPCETRHQETQGSISESCVDILSMKVLEDMGFHGHMARAALILSRSDTSAALELLLKAQHICLPHDIDGATLAQEISAAMLSVDTANVSAEGMMRLVDVLSRDTAQLAAAAVFVDLDVLRRFLVTMPAEHVQDAAWTPDVLEVMSLCIQLLVSPPKPAADPSQQHENVRPVHQWR